MNEQQRAHAEAALATACAKYPHEPRASAHVPRSLPPALQDRYEQLLSFAKNPNWKLTAQENLAAARELVDTAFHLDAIDAGPFNAYVIETNIAKLECLDAMMVRAVDARSRGHAGADENGVRPAVSEDGAYRFNPLTGQHE